MKVIQLVQGGLAHQFAKYGANLLVRFVYLRLTETFWKASLGYVHTVPASETERRRKCTG